MQRIAVGIVILFLIALCGILLVESAGGSGPPAPSTEGDRTLKFMIGGDATESATEVPSSKANDQGAAKKPGVSPTPKTPKTPWRAPEPVLRYKVVKGDNPMKIATEFFGIGTNELADRILKANKLKSAKDLKIDAELAIPVDHFDRFIADGRKSIRDVAKRFYKSETIVSPLRHANPNLPKDPNLPIPVGFTVFIPR